MRHMHVDHCFHFINFSQNESALLDFHFAFSNLITEEMSHYRSVIYPTVIMRYNNYPVVFPIALIKYISLDFFAIL